MLANFTSEEKPKLYSQFKKEYFNKKIDRFRNDLTNIRTSSLHNDDKHKLLIEFSKILNDQSFLIN